MDLLWVEKYRPKTLDEIVVSDEIRSKVLYWLEDPKVRLPNLIFIGPPGCGKTTLARLIVSNVVKHGSDYLFINGSADRGIQAIKETVSEFMKYEPSEFSPVKILFIDEADNLTTDAFKALRSIMEAYQHHCRLLMTGNYENFPEAIVSRSTVVRFQSLPYQFVMERVSSILKQENIGFDEEALKKLVDYFYPDLRRIINYAQMISSKGFLDISGLENVLDEKQLFVVELWDFVSFDQKDYLSQRKMRELLVMIKKLNFGVQDYVMLLNNINLKIDAEMNKFLDDSNVGDKLAYYLNLKVLLSKTSYYIKHSPLPEGFFIEFLYKILQLKTNA